MSPALSSWLLNPTKNMQQQRRTAFLLDVQDLTIPFKRRGSDIILMVDKSRFRDITNSTIIPGTLTTQFTILSTLQSVVTIHNTTHLQYTTTFKALSLVNAKNKNFAIESETKRTDI